MSDDLGLESVAAARVTPTDARAWAKALGRYRQPSSARGAAEIAVTVVPFAALWTLMGIAVTSGYWPALLLALPAAGIPGPTLHDPARLRPWRLLRPAMGK